MRVSLVPVIAVALSAVLLASACTNTEEETAVTESTQTQEAEASLPAVYSMPVEPRYFDHAEIESIL